MVAKACPARPCLEFFFHLQPFNLRTNALPAQPVNYYYTNVDPNYTPVCYSSDYTPISFSTSYTHAQRCPDRFSDPTAFYRLANTNGQANSGDLTDGQRNAALTKEWEKVSELATSYSAAVQYDSAARLLESYQRYREAMPYYLQMRDYANAQRVWGLLPQATDDDQQYSKLIAIQLNLYANGQTWSKLDSTNKATIAVLARNNTVTGYMAQEIAVHLGITPAYSWPRPALLDSSLAGGSSRKVQQGTSATGKLTSALTLFPNPTNGGVTITTTTAGTIHVTDVAGKQVATWLVVKGNNQVQLPVSSAPGIYVIQFTATDGSLHATTRLVYQP